MSNLKVTIVIPVYQVEDYIESCLTSVVNQTYSGEIECVVVDDCGTDSSWQIVENFMSEYNGKIDFKIIRHTENKGLSAARNTGMDHAAGEYIYFLDSDDEITPECIERLVKPLENYKYDFVTADFTIVGGRPVTTYLKARGEYKSGIKEAYYRKEWNVTAWNKLCNVDFLKRNDLRFKEGIIHEDILWSFYLANFANSMYALEDKTYIYNTRETSIMGTMKITRSKDSKILIYSDINSFLAKRGLDNKDDIAYIYRIKFEMFNDIRSWDLKNAKPYLLALKKATRVSPFKAYRMGLMSSKNIIKYCYMMLPECVVYPYYYIVNHLISMTTKFKRMVYN